MSILKEFSNHLPYRERHSTLASYLIVSGMMACFGVTIVQLGQRFSGDWQGVYLVWIAFLVSLESLITHSQRKRFTLFSGEWFIYRLSEWIVLFIFIKLALYLVHGPGQLLDDIPLWRQDFGRYFFTGEYVGVLIVAFLVWLLSAAFSSDLSELEDDPEFYGPDLPEAQKSRAQVRRRIADLVLGVGAVMIFVTALLRIEWQARWLQGRPPQGGLYNILAYFLLGLVLLSITQFSMLRMRWRDENIPFSREIASRWALYSFIFLLGLVIISGLLPTNYSIGLLTLGNYLIYFIMSLLQLLWFILLMPLFLLASFLAMLLKSDQPEPPRLGNLTPPQLPPSPAPGEGVPWVEALKSLIFWIVFFGVILFSIRFLLMENKELTGRLRSTPLAGWLLQIWEQLAGWLGRVNQRVGAAVSSQLKRLRRSVGGPPGAGNWRFVNVRRLPPREQVLFFYQAFLRRGGEHGLPRHPSQTPYEYSGSLRVGMTELEDDPSAREDLASLTDRFVEARYSRHEITPDHASLARRAWEHIRRYLRKKVIGDK